MSNDPRNEEARKAWREKDRQKRIAEPRIAASRPAREHSPSKNAVDEMAQSMRRASADSNSLDQTVFFSSEAITHGLAALLAELVEIRSKLAESGSADAKFAAVLAELVKIRERLDSLEQHLKKC